MRALVTGGAGFIGSALVDRLLADGHEVTAVDDLSTGKLFNLQQARRDPDLPLSFQRADVTSTALAPIFDHAQPDVVFHLAAQIDIRHSVDDPVHDAMVNVVGTVNLLECARKAGVRKVIFATSGGSIYGEPKPSELPVAEDYVAYPQAPYAASKLGVEAHFQAFEALYGLQWSALAFGNVYGPRQDPGGEAGVVSIFGSAMLEGRGTTIYGDGSQTRDFIYVRDAVDAFVATIDHGHGQRINVGSGRETSVNDLYAALADIIGYSEKPRHADPRAGELHRIALDVSKAATELNWHPVTTLREGLSATVSWLRGSA